LSFVGSTTIELGTTNWWCLCWPIFSCYYERDRKFNKELNGNRRRPTWCSTFQSL